jgi:hypothetical protein
MNNLLKRLAVFIISALMLSSCGDSSTNPTTINVNISGYAQKGPYREGSQIYYQELTESMTPDGNYANGSIKSDVGDFSFQERIGSDYIRLITTGRYYNEYDGANTLANLELRAIAKVSENINCNINILTTIAMDRVSTLINRDNLSYTEADQQARYEILNIFNIDDQNVDRFSNMDISKTGDQNGILLAISLTIQSWDDPEWITFEIERISDDIKLDGIIDNTDILDNLSSQARHLIIYNYVENIRTNLEERYSQLGMEVTIPNFEKYLLKIAGMEK